LPIATDRDERIDPGVGEAAEQLLGAIDLLPRPVGLLRGVGRGIAAVRRAEDGAAEVRDPPDRVAGQFDDAPIGVVLGEHQPVEPVADPDDVTAPVARCERHRPDDRVETRRVTAPGADADACDPLHAPQCRSP
jgi:hypothetical protein